MKILKNLELIAVLLIIVGMVLGLGKAAIDYICSIPSKPVTATVVVLAPTEAEKAQYLAGLKRQVEFMEAKQKKEAGL